MHKLEKPKVAVLGCGYWGKNLVRNFQQLGALSAVQDINPATVDAISLEYGVPSLSFDQILADKRISGVVIAAPAERHADLADACLDAGKDVFVEKPLALTVGEAEELCLKAERQKRILMVGHLLQYHPAFMKLKEMCVKGKLGDLQYVYSNRLNLGKFRTEENILWSFAPHDLSMILSILGHDIESVYASGNSFLNINVPDVTTTHIHFTGGRAAHVFVSWLHPFKEQRLIAIGSKGMVVFDDSREWAGKLAFYPDPVSWENGVANPSRAEHQLIPVEEAEPLKLECQHFMDCMETRISPRTNGDEGLLVLRVLDMAQRSLENHHEIKLG